MCEFHHCETCEYSCNRDNEDGEEYLYCELGDCETYDENGCDSWKERYIDWE